MKRKENFFPIFFLFLALSILILSFSRFGLLSGVFDILTKGASVVGKTAYQVFSFNSESSRLRELKAENLALINRLSDQKRLEAENKALLSQFQTAVPRSYNLLKGEVVGAPDFIPRVSNPSNTILDKGEKDKVKVGMALVLGNNLIGEITKTTAYFSKAILINNASFSLIANTENGAEGVIRGLGDGLVLDNVLVSENLKIGDLVLTAGDMDLEGVGVPPGLIIGKIISIEKNPSAFFQKAKVESSIDLTKLSVVFIMAQSK